jgi:DNA-3-methyladenine glycosylase
VVAPLLLGAVLTHAGVSLRITEVEAYSGPGDDAASHAHGGLTPRTVPMFGPVAHAYVYLSYGVHRCLNVVCHPPGVAGAVLIRGGEVVGGIEAAQQRRPRIPARQLARGPGCVTKVLAVDLDLTGSDLRRGPLRLALAGEAPVPTSGVRIGITKAVERPWRFWIEGAPGVSRHPRAG